MSDLNEKKREKILIGLVVAALLYGLFDYALRSSDADKESGKEREQLEATFVLVNESLVSVSATRREGRALEVLNAASDQWPEGVFLDIIPSVEYMGEEDAPSSKSDALVYSGYMAMGDKKFAVINGIEYQSGDIVEGFLLKEVNPMEIVVIKNGRPVRVPFKIVEEP